MIHWSVCPSGSEHLGGKVLPLLELHTHPNRGGGLEVVGCPGGELDRKTEDANELHGYRELENPHGFDWGACGFGPSKPTLDSNSSLVWLLDDFHIGPAAFCDFARGLSHFFSRHHGGLAPLEDHRAEAGSTRMG